MAELVTIIVPVYNEGVFFEECIDSLISQSYKNLEIIVVDDGSEETNARYYEKVAKKDQRIRLFHIKNQGVSNARNFGISESRGKWIAFVDADDCLMPDALSFLVHNAADSKLIAGNYCKGRELVPATNQEEPVTRLFSAYAIRAVSLEYEKYIGRYDFLSAKNSAYFMSACAKLYDGDLIRRENIRFNDQLKYSEDLLFNLDYLKKIDQAVLSNYIVYFYRKNLSSATHKKGSKIIDEYQKMVDVFLQSGHPGVDAFCAYYLLYSFLNVVSWKDKMLCEQYLNLVKTEPIASTIASYDPGYLTGPQGEFIKITCVLWQKGRYGLSYWFAQLYLTVRGLVKKG